MTALAITPIRVLVADDDDALRELVARVLRRRGYDVATVRDGAEALEALGDSLLGITPVRPDIVVADFRMPFMTGLHIQAALRGVTPVIPMILITAFGDTKTHALADRLGVAMLIDKPFDMDLLCIAISHIAPSRHLRCL
jgi:CheY-like chemotaxis protein